MPHLKPEDRVLLAIAASRQPPSMNQICKRSGLGPGSVYLAVNKLQLKRLIVEARLDGEPMDEHAPEHASSASLGASSLTSRPSRRFTLEDAGARRAAELTFRHEPSKRKYGPSEALVDQRGCAWNLLMAEYLAFRIEHAHMERSNGSARVSGTQPSGRRVTFSSGHMSTPQEPKELPAIGHARDSAMNRRLSGKALVLVGSGGTAACVAGEVADATGVGWIIPLSILLGLELGSTVADRITKPSREQERLLGSISERLEVQAKSFLEHYNLPSLAILAICTERDFQAASSAVDGFLQRARAAFDAARLVPPVRASRSVCDNVSEQTSRLASAEEALDTVLQTEFLPAWEASSGMTL